MKPNCKINFRSIVDLKQSQSWENVKVIVWQANFNVIVD